MTKRTALVIGVGAETGLGAVLCRRFASEGLHALISGRTPSKFEQSVRSIAAVIDGGFDGERLRSGRPRDVCDARRSGVQ